MSIRSGFLRVLPAVIVVAVVVFGWRYRDVLVRAVGEIRSAYLPPVLLAVVAAAVAIFAMAQVSRTLLAAGEVQVRLRSCVSLALSANAWSATLPGGQAFAALLSFHVMRSWGASALLCSWQIVLSATLSTMWLVALGVAAVFVLGASLSLTSLLVTLVALVGVTWLVFYLAHHPDVLIPPTLWGLGVVNRVRRRPRDDGADSVVEHIRQLDAVTLTPGRFFVAAVMSLINWVADIVVLWACVWAVVGAAPTWESSATNTTVMGVVLAFVTSKIAGTVQATPGGLGPVEAALMATLVAAGLPATTALGVALIYRLITFFGLVAVGWVVYLIAYNDVGRSLRQGVD